MDGEASGAVGEQPAAAGGQRDQLVEIETRRGIGEEVDGGGGDDGGGVVDGAEQPEDALDGVAGGERVDGELQEGRAGDAVPLGAARLDDAGGEQVVELRGDQVGEEAGELVEGGGRAGFVEVDELVGGEAEHLTEIGAVAPTGQQVTDAGERVATVLEPGDQLEPRDVGGSVDADPPAALGRGEQAEGLVLADGANGDPSAPGELVDGELPIVLGRHGRSRIHGWTVTPFTVTVNTVTDWTEPLLGVLRAATSTPALEYDGPPRPLTGGFWAELVAFRLRDAPDGWDGDLVARVMPDPATARKESAVQAEVAAQGFPTPAVRLVGGPDDGLGRAFMVMDLASGAPMVGGLDGLGALAALPRLARRLPTALGAVMADLHRVDPVPVRARLATSGDGGASGLMGFVARLGDQAGLASRDDLVSVVGWLRANPPPPEPDVVCHGDLHPFNVLVDTAGTTTVLDWSAAVLGPRAYDVAFTSLLLSEPPVVLPRVLAPAGRAGGRMLARRFRRAYTSELGTGIDPASLRWHEAVVCLRALVEVAMWVAAGEIDGRGGHPWLISGPAFAERLTRLTGTAVRAR